MVAWLSLDGSALLEGDFNRHGGQQLGERANIVFGGLHHRPGIATITVGGVKYTYEGDVIDLIELRQHPAWPTTVEPESAFVRTPHLKHQQLLD